MWLPKLIVSPRSWWYEGSIPVFLFGTIFLPLSNNHTTYPSIYVHVIIYAQSDIILLYNNIKQSHKFQVRRGFVYMGFLIFPQVVRPLFWLNKIHFQK